MDHTFEQRFLAARRPVIARRFEHLNPMQQQAVLTTQGPLLLLAGAGSGKTTVLINRIANLIRFGSASDSVEIPAFITEEEVEYLEYYLHSVTLSKTNFRQCFPGYLGHFRKWELYSEK